MLSKNYENIEKNLTKLELNTTIVFTISLFISLSLVYNNYLKYSKKDFYSDELAHYIGIFNRTLVVILSFSYLYINIQNKKIAKEKGNKIDLFDLQISASVLSTIATLIVLYTVINNEDYSVVGIENPSI